VSAGGLTTRAELRYDRSTDAVFLSHDDGRRRSQMTALLGAIYAF
jgi:hypothetical protein